MIKPSTAPPCTPAFHPASFLCIMNCTADGWNQPYKHTVMATSLSILSSSIENRAMHERETHCPSMLSSTCSSLLCVMLYSQNWYWICQQGLNTSAFDSRKDMDCPLQILPVSDSSSLLLHDSIHYLSIHVLYLFFALSHNPHFVLRSSLCARNSWPCKKFPISLVLMCEVALYPAVIPPQHD